MNQLLKLTQIRSDDWIESKQGMEWSSNWVRQRWLIHYKEAFTYLFPTLSKSLWILSRHVLCLGFLFSSPIFRSRASCVATDVQHFVRSHFKENLNGSRARTSLASIKSEWELNLNAFSDKKNKLMKYV